MDIGTLTGAIEIEDLGSSAMTLMISKAKEFAENFEGALGGIAIGASIAVAAIGATAGAIAALGNRGSDVNDVAKTLDHFAGSAENATAIMDRMREGTLGTIDNFVLAKDAARLLSAGVKLTADDFGTLSSAAFVLQNRGLGTTKEMLDLVSDAMVTGRTRALAMKLGVVDVGDAEANYAKSLGITKDMLSDAGKAESHRIAVLGMLNSAVADAGAQQRDFGEQIEFAITSVKNWIDELAQAVASSPAVTQAMTDIGSAVMEAFGGSSEAAIKNIISGIDSFASGVSAVTPYIVTFKNIVVEVFSFLNDHKEVLASIAAGYVLVQGATIAVTAVQGALAFGVVGVTAAIDAATASVTAFVIATGPVIIAIAAVSAAVYGAAHAWETYKTNQDTAQQTARTLAQEQQNLANINKKYGTSFTDYGNAVRYAQHEMQNARDDQALLNAVLAAGDKLDQSASVNTGKYAASMIDSAAAAKKYAEAHKALNDAIKQAAGALVPLSVEQKIQIQNYAKLKLSNSEIASILKVTESAVALYGDEWRKTNEAMKEADGGVKTLAIGDLRGIFNPAVLAAVDATAALQKQLQFTFRQGIPEATVASLDLATAIDKDVYSTKALSEAWEKAHPKLTRINTAMEEWAAQLTQLAQVSGGTFGGVIKDIAQVVVSYTMAAKAAENFAIARTKTDKALAIAQGLTSMASATGQGSTIARTAGGALTGAMTGAMIGSVVPVIGTAVGAGVGAIAGAAVGLYRGLAAKLHKEMAVNPIRSSFFDMAGGLDVLNPKVMQLTGNLSLVEAIFKAKTIDQYNAAIQALNDTIAFSDAAMQTLDETTKKYGFTIDELGPAMQRQELDQQAQTLYQDYQVLTAAGIDLTAIHVRMAEEVNNYVKNALAMGIEVPMAMKPMLEAMALQGVLTDAAGNKITNLEDSGISFAMTMSEGFKALITSVEKLTDAISRGLGLAIQNIPQPVIHGKVDWSVDQVPPPDGFASGGVVYAASGANIVPFTPRGTDTVPAMLTPGERVLSVSQNKQFEHAAGAGKVSVVIPFNAEGRELARAVVEFIPDELRKRGVM